MTVRGMGGKACFFIPLTNIPLTTIAFPGGSLSQFGCDFAALCSFQQEFFSTEKKLTANGIERPLPDLHGGRKDGDEIRGSQEFAPPDDLRDAFLGTMNHKLLYEAECGIGWRE
jgi:hypothetical protein